MDSARSISDNSHREGVLDPAGAAKDMYWSSDSGYIFFNMEGSLPPDPSPITYSYHIGGFGGLTTPVLNNIKTITLDLSVRGVPKVKAGREPNIHLMVDILKVFSGANQINIASRPVVQFEEYSRIIAGNYEDMFRHDHTENE